jgi:hypothetical protein
MSLTWIMILLYLPVIRDYIGFGSMRLVDRLFPLASWVIYLAARELKKAIRRRRENKQMVTVNAEIVPTQNTP